MIKAALAIALLPPAAWFTARAVEKPFHIILLSFIGYSLIGYFMFFGIFSIFQFYVILGLAVFGLNLAAGRQYGVSRAFLWEILFPMTGFLLLGALSLRLAKDPGITLVYLRNYTGSLLFTFLVFQFLTDEKDIRTFCKVLVVILAANAGLGVVQVVGGAAYYPVSYLLPGAADADWSPMMVAPKPRGFYNMSFEYAKDLLFAVMPVLALVLMSYRTKWRPALFAVLGLGIVAIATSQVRSTQIAFVLGVAYILYRAVQDTPNKGATFVRGALVIGAITAVAVVYVSANPYLMRRYMLGDSSMFLRFVLLAMGAQILHEHWLWGIGMGNFKSVYYEYLPQIFRDKATFSGKALQPHNVFLDMWTGGGIFVLILYVAIFLFTFLALERVRRWNPSRFLRVVSVGFQAFLIGYFVECLFHNHIFDNNYWLLIGLSYAMLSMTPKKPTESE